MLRKVFLTPGVQIDRILPPSRIAACPNIHFGKGTVFFSKFYQLDRINETNRVARRPFLLHILQK